MGRDAADPDRPHCGRCGDESLSATLMLIPLAAPAGDSSYSTVICDTCTQRVVDLLVNPHMFITAQTTDEQTSMAEIMIDGTGISRPDAIAMLINAAEMLNTGETEVIDHDDPTNNQDES